MNGVEQIRHGEHLYAIIVRADAVSGQKYNFLTEPENPLQLGVNHYTAGELVAPHHHLPVSLEVRKIQEFLLINRGRLNMKLFEPETRSQLSVHELGPKDMVLLLHGGHSFEVLEPCQIIEVKQGPYSGKSNDKVVYSP
jgi:hypothetical protein